MEHLNISKLCMKIEYYGEKYNFLYSKSGEWRKNNNILTSINENGDKFSIEVKERNGYILLLPSIIINPQNGYKQVLRYILSGFINSKPKVAIYNDAEFEAGRNKSLYGMASEAISTGLINNQWINGADYIAYRENEGSGVIGVVTFNEYFSSIRLNQNGQFAYDSYANEHWLTLDDVSVSANQEIKLDTLAIIKSDENEAIDTYGKIIKSFSGNRKNHKAVSGWCSWYYYGPAVTEKCVLENLSVIKEKQIPFEVIQIDDGWQKRNGDWEANEKFSMGMQKLADTIKKNGFIAGIWVAPFKFDKESTVVKANPEWFIKRGNEFLPDYSQNGLQNYLYELFVKLSKKWGYRYIKVDLIDGAIAYNGYSKESFNGIKNVKKAYEIMRSAVTEDTHILACTSPLGVIAGLADSVRCSMDIFENWESLKNVARRQLKRLYVSQYANVDPDCLLLRTADKEDEECYRPCVRNIEEVKTFITYVSVTGGIVMNSDKLILFNDDDFDKLKVLFPLNEKPCICLDLFKEELPSLFQYRREDVKVYAVINWQEQTKEVEFAVDNEFVYRFWAKKIEKVSKKVKIVLAPHTSEILYFSNEPANFHKFKNSIIGEIK